MSDGEATFKLLKLSTWGPEFWLDGCILGVLLLVYLIPALITNSDYGLMYDVSELYVGDRNVAYYCTLDSDYLRYEIPMPMPIYEAADHPDFQRICINSPAAPATTRPHQIWPLGPVSSSLTKHLFYGLGILPAIEAHHVAPMLWFAFLLGLTYCFARAHFGRIAAVFAVIALMTHPRLVAHSHNNLKDIPIMALFSATVFLVHSAISRCCWRRILLGGVVWGLALATKGNALVLPAILLPWFGFVLWRRRNTRIALWKPKPIIAMFCFPIIGLVAAAICWPMLLLDFPVQLTRHISYITARGFTQGQGTLNTTSLIHLFTTTPVQVLLVAGLGVIVLIRKKGEEIEKALLLLLWFLVTVARVSAPGTNDHDVIRHWMEFLVPVALFCGVGCQYLIEIARSWRERLPSVFRSERVIACVLGLVLFTWPIVWMIQNHPYELVYYNGLIGGLPGAKKAGLPASTDYWSNSYTMGMRWLNANAEKDAVLVVPISADAVAFMADVRLRRDIHFLPTNEWAPERTARELANLSGVVYLMYITRVEHYEPLLRVIDERCRPVHQILVDGAPILKIIRFEKGPGPIPLPPAPTHRESK